jgi:ankyrin repeat protein
MYCSNQFHFGSICLLLRSGYTQTITTVLITFACLLSLFCPCAYAIDPIEIHRAAERGDMDEIRKIVEERPELVNHQSFAHSYMTPLHIAIQKDNFEMVRFLLSKGANPNVNDFVKEPLFDAVIWGNGEIVKLLLDYGADANVKNQEGEDTFLIALKEGRHDLAGILAESADNQINYAAWLGDLETCRDILQKEPSLANHKGLGGRTPLHIASLANQEKMVEFLLSQEANIEGTTDMGRTALHCAAFSGGQKVAEFLLSKGANVKARSGDYNNYTPLHVAAEENNVIVAKILLEYGANINEKSFMDWTPLHVAVGANRIEMVRFLIEAGANANALSDPNFSKIKKGQTPYEIALELGHNEVARLLRNKTSFFHRGFNLILLLGIVILLTIFALERIRVKRKRNRKQ